MKLSTNFDSSEFTNSEIDGERLYLLTSLCNNILEPVRSFLGCSLTITSSIRTSEDYQRLIDSGYHPSETSDHLYDNPVKIIDPEKRKIWGEYYTCGVGAVDIVPACGTDLAWSRLSQYFNKSRKTIDLPVPFLQIEIGQCIHEFGSGTNWIHIANSPRIKFSDNFVNKFLNRPCFLTSSNKGISYQEV